ncbi:amidohydrolase family protein [Clostridium estertheticum]|uniref:amidohydrolase family protein n=1 Tax=Clostridium estertheticum TaxID=238834 RepID=UPI001C6EC006|nr:amidohydrolase family protein [Clostridium estertheticum]MBW9152864.1 amidohydrolase family protein [Clostridium estertheticum]WLC82762.1 amidohydrolase family protein [Clostridium estertheticum]
MIIIIKNGEVYAPEYIGKMDIVIAGGKIEAIAKSVSVPQDFAKVRVIDADRSINLFDAGIEFAKLGGIIDMTTSSDPDHLEEDEVKASRALKMALERGIPVEQIQFTSDGQGSMPIFNKKRELIGLGIGFTKSLYIEVRDAVLKDGVDLEVALKVITSNVATNLKLYNKGFVQEGRDADLVLVNKNDLSIETVFAKGVELVSKGQVLVKGTFEK